MNPPPELFPSDRPVRSDFARRGAPSYALRRLATLVVLIGILVGGGYWIWGHASSAPGEIPTVKADGAYKQRPDQPGGIDIPHQDVQVYHEIDGSAASANAKPAIEHMLPPPEQPNPALAHIAPPSTAASNDAPLENLAPAAKNAVADTPLSPAPAAPIIATTVTPPVAVPAPVAAVPTPSPAPVAVQPPAAAVPAPSVKGGTIVQVAAMPDEAAAGVAAQKYQAKYGAVLGSAHLHPVRADLGARGIFYRIQSQPLAERQAQAICAAIKNMNGGCLLVRP